MRGRWARASTPFPYHRTASREPKNHLFCSTAALPPACAESDARRALTEKRGMMIIRQSLLDGAALPAPKPAPRKASKVSKCPSAKPTGPGGGGWWQSNPAKLQQRWFFFLPRQEENKILENIRKKKKVVGKIVSLPRVRRPTG